MVPGFMCLVLRWQKNRYDVFMRMARVCQADGVAIAARRISEEKHEIVVPRFRRDRTCFLSPFFASVSRIFPVLPVSLFPPSRVLLPRNKIRFDVNLSTDISSRGASLGPSFVLPLFSTSARVYRSRHVAHEFRVYIICLFSSPPFWLIRRQWG